MTYLATLYSPSLDLFDTDCNSNVWGSADIAFWVEHLPEYYNRAHKVNDFQIISIVKMGE
jgi:hypothetical protein